MAGGTIVEALCKKVVRFEELMGVASLDLLVTLSNRLDNVVGNIKALAQNLAVFIMKTNNKHVVMLDDVTSLSDALKAQMKVFKHEMVVFKSSASNLSPSLEPLPSKIKVPDPKPFNVARNVKELENFIWDMEQYFKG